MGPGWGLCPLGSLKSPSGTGRHMVCKAALISGGDVGRPVAETVLEERWIR